MCFCVWLLDLIKEVLSLDDEIQKLAAELYQQKSVLIMGRGYHYATCLEGALVSTHSLIVSQLDCGVQCRFDSLKLWVFFLILCRKSRRSRTCIQRVSWLES